MRAEAPSPIRNPSEKPNALGGKSNALAGLKWNAPLRITASRRQQCANPERYGQAAD